MNRITMGLCAAALLFAFAAPNSALAKKPEGLLLKIEKIKFTKSFTFEGTMEPSFFAGVRKYDDDGNWTMPTLNCLLHRDGIQKNQDNEVNEYLFLPREFETHEGFAVEFSVRERGFQNGLLGRQEVYLAQTDQHPRLVLKGAYGKFAEVVYSTEPVTSHPINAGEQDTGLPVPIWVKEVRIKPLEESMRMFWRLRNALTKGLSTI